MVGLNPISFTFLNLSVAKLVINYHAVGSRIPLHFHLPIYRSLGVTKFRVYTTWYTVQIHLLEHSRVNICHRGATGQRGWALARARIPIYPLFDTNTHFFPIFRLSLQPNHSTKVRKILFGVSSMTDDYLYKF